MDCTQLKEATSNLDVTFGHSKREAIKLDEWAGNNQRFGFDFRNGFDWFENPKFVSANFFSEFSVDPTQPPTF
jgi:hypothetical protein